MEEPAMVPETPGTCIHSSLLQKNFWSLHLYPRVIPFSSNPSLAISASWRRGFGVHTYAGDAGGGIWGEGVVDPIYLHSHEIGSVKVGFLSGRGG